jgi:ADP-heptose:LPS heptosyltransferase
MAKKAIGFCMGQIGDFAISTVAARMFKNFHPDWKLVLGVHKKYQQLIPLFYQHPFFDSFHVYDSYDEWPNEKDLIYIGGSKYDILYNPMTAHTNDDWYKRYHQTQEMCAMYGLPIPKNKDDCKVIMSNWYAPYVEYLPNYVCLAPIGGAYNYPNDKSYSKEQVAIIVNYLKSKYNYDVIQLGGPGEPVFDGCLCKSGQISYLESMKLVYGSRGLITVDTGINWHSSAFGKNTLACYSNEYYKKEFIQSIQPVNRNAIYLDEGSIGKITEEQLVNGIDNLLAS